MLLEELDAARQLARAAGRAMMPYWGNVAEESKGAGSPVSEADRLANRIIVEGLQSQFPEDGVLAEESRDTVARLGCERVWMVDPLDGTREFLDGLAEFCVMIGLAIDGAARLGVLYCPADDALYSGVVGGAAWVERSGRRDRLEATRAATGSLRLVGSRSHPDRRLVAIQQALGITEVRPSGSVGVKCMVVAQGMCELYVHPVPYLKEWDTCAPEAVLRAAGGWVSDCAGDRLVYNKREPNQPLGIVAARPGVAEQALPAIRAVYPGEAENAVLATA